jgi:hypothetical protein
MVQLSVTRCSCINILWVSLVSFAAITLCVASRRVFVVVISLTTQSVNFWIHPRTFSLPVLYARSTQRLRAVGQNFDPHRVRKFCCLPAGQKLLWGSRDFKLCSNPYAFHRKFHKNIAEDTTKVMAFRGRLPVRLNASLFYHFNYFGCDVSFTKVDGIKKLSDFRYLRDSMKRTLVSKRKKEAQMKVYKQRQHQS